MTRGTPGTTGLVDSSNAGSCTFTAMGDSNRHLLVFLTAFSNVGAFSVSAATLGGTALTLVGHIGTSGTTPEVFIYERLNASSGTISFSFSANIYGTINYCEWSDATQSALSSLFAGNTGGGVGAGTATQTDTVASGEDMVFLSCHHWGVTPSDAYFGASQTKLWSAGEGAGLFQVGACSVKTGAGSVTQTYSNGDPDQAWAACCLTMAPYAPAIQTALPASDITTAGWKTEAMTTPLYVSIDEAVASDAEYIQSGLTPSNDECEVKLQSLSAPGAGTRTVKFRYRKTGTDAIDLTVSLVQGTTVIHTETFTGITATWTDGTMTITEAISDYTDLRLRFKANHP